MSNFLQANKLSKEIKNDAINSVLLSSVIIFAPALFISLTRISITGLSPIYLIQTSLFVLVSILFLFRFRLSLNFKVYLFQLILFSIAVSGLHYFGYFANTKLFFILIPVFFWFFHTKKAAILSSIICSITFGAYAWLYIYGLLAYPVAPNEFIMYGNSWAMNGLVMATIMVYFIVLFSKLIHVQQKSFSVLKDSEEKYKFLTENIKDVIWVIDAETRRYIYVSPSLEKVRGYKPSEFIGARISDFTPSYSTMNADKLIDERLKNFNQNDAPIYATVEIDVFHKNGHTICMEVNSHYRLNPITNRIELIGTSRDITDRKKAQLELEKSEERYQLAIAASNLGIWDWFTDSEEVYFSDMWKQQIGYAPDELPPLFEVWLAHLHPDEKEEKKEALQLYLNNPLGQFVMEFRFRHKQGHYIWIHSRAETILNNEGKVVRMYGTHLDITPLKDHENWLIEKNTLLEKTNAELDNFVYRISHDIRAPLSSCFGIFDIMEREKVMDQYSQPYFNLLKEVLTRQEAVIKNILDYSRNSRGELILEKIPLKKMARLTFRDLKYMEKGKTKVKLSTSMDDAFTFISDKNRIQFILSNLISNALKYAAQEKDTIIAITASQNENETIIEVTDNGIGINKNVLPNIFKMFYRGSLKSTGSGLGLYIVKEAVEKLKGKIEVKSEPEKFTTFTITLPEQTK